MTSPDLIGSSNPICRLPTLSSTRESTLTLPIAWPCHSFYLPLRLTGATTKSTRLSHNFSHKPSVKLSRCHTVGQHQVTQYLSRRVTMCRARWSNILTQTFRPSTTHNNNQPDMMSVVTLCQVCLPPSQETMLLYRHQPLLPAQAPTPRRLNPAALLPLEMFSRQL